MNDKTPETPEDWEARAEKEILENNKPTHLLLVAAVESEVFAISGVTPNDIKILVAEKFCEKILNDWDRVVFSKPDIGVDGKPVIKCSIALSLENNIERINP